MAKCLHFERKLSVAAFKVSSLVHPGEGVLIQTGLIVERVGHNWFAYHLERVALVLLCNQGAAGVEELGLSEND